MCLDFRYYDILTWQGWLAPITYIHSTLFDKNYDSKSLNSPLAIKFSLKKQQAGASQQDKA